MTNHTGTRSSFGVPLVTTALVLLAIAAVLFATGGVPQDPRYHTLADARTLAGIPNFANVATNLPFLLVGIAGLVHCALRGATGDPTGAWFALFAGATLVAFGSAYYHWVPTSATLVWDRLPMTVAFMGLFAAVVGEHLGERIGRALLVPALLAGVASVLWWALRDDLRPYIVVQAAPIVAIAIALALFPGRYTHRRYFAYAFGFYALAKLAEIGDRPIYEWTAHAISGHSLKHVLAAASLFCFYLMLRRRQSVAARATRRPAS